MHMVWMKSVGGRLETRIQYSKNIVYNTFPFPLINDKQKEQLNLHVFEVIDERAKYPEKWGKGKWTAKTIEDAKQMAIDFARSVS